MTADRTPALILGTRAYSEVLMDMFEDQIDIVGAVENMDPARTADTLAGLPIHWQGDIAAMAATHRLVCAIGTTHRKAWIEDCLALGFDFATLVHPSSTVSRRSTLGAGVIIDAGCVVAGFSTLSDHCRIGRRASIGHHTVIGRYTTVHPGTIISGNCRIGEQVTLGSGTIVIDGISIGDGAVTAAGTVVNRDLPPAVLAAGNPAQTKRTDYGPK